MKEFIVNYQPEIIRFLLILIIGQVVIRVILKILSHATTNEKLDPTIGKFSVGLIKFLLYAAYLIILLTVIGIPMTTFVAMLGAIGLAIALALQANLSNFSSALVILFFKPFKVGDFIESSSNMGTVKEIQLLFTYIITPDNKIVIIPNSELVNGRVINYSSEKNRRIDLVFSASYENDVDIVINLIKGVVMGNPMILDDPESVIRLANHGSSALEYDVKIWVCKEDFWSVKYQMHEDVRKVFVMNGIKIPYPQRELWLQNVDEVDV